MKMRRISKKEMETIHPAIPDAYEKLERITADTLPADLGRHKRTGTRKMQIGGAGGAAAEYQPPPGDHEAMHFFLYYRPIDDRLLVIAAVAPRDLADAMKAEMSKAIPGWEFSPRPTETIRNVRPE